MKQFMGDDFLLSTKTAERLYHDCAARLPIIDYHCHVSPREIFEDRRYDNITQVWLGGDHYKWRIMRACGVSEELVTGGADDYDKFLAYAKALPYAIGNAVNHWTHLELKRYFGIEAPLNGDTAPEIWEACNKQLQSGLTVREIIRQSNVVGLATTDDPADSLEWHAKIAADPAMSGTDVKPAWRPDNALGIHKPGFAEYMARLGSPSTMRGLTDALFALMDNFDAHGCTASDHGLDFLEYVPASEAELDAIMSHALNGGTLSHEQVAAYQYALLLRLGSEYKRRGWVMELHYGTIRNINTAQFKRLGPDTGFDAIAPSQSVSGLPRLLDELETSGSLPKTVLFSLSPSHNAMLNTIAASFQHECERGYVQQGSAWWHNDTLHGMREQLRTMASTGVLGNFLGMVTDSRSFLSYTRHEYFRRLLCGIIGGWAENGECQSDIDYLGGLISDISFGNAKRFFGYR